MKIFAIPNWLLLAYVGVLASVQIIMIIIWATVIPTTLTYIPVPRESFVVHSCHSGDSWAVIAGVEYAYFILLFLFCAIFAWRVRKIPISEYKEAKEIGYSVYNIGFVAVIAIPLSNVFWYDPTAKVAVITAATCFSSIVSINCLFITKFFTIWSDNETSETSHNSKSTASTKHQGRSQSVNSSMKVVVHDSRRSSTRNPDGLSSDEESPASDEDSSDAEKDKDPSSSSSSE